MLSHKMDFNNIVVSIGMVFANPVTNLDYICMQIVSQGQQNKFYEHVHVLRCNPS